MQQPNFVGARLPTTFLVGELSYDNIIIGNLNMQYYSKNERPIYLFSQVITMLLGEYEFTYNFQKVETPCWISKAIFVVFLVEMSVVMMNLVLGLGMVSSTNFWSQ